MNALRFVLDASIALAWCFEDEPSAYAERVLERLGEGEAYVPALWALEIGNALLSAERRGRLTPAESTRFLELLRQLPIHLEEMPLPRVWGEILTLARAYQLSTYDAAYLDLAMRLGLPLATLDDALHQAATHCGVKML
ncbi:MAG: type II toxin-antitoxin system VapC family toxin [Anaerolineae bacterium]|nr:type II toxin-antitoxin system VapC family toxin [Anaerolineae bacterium]MDW8101068.1 type II toxin-antitoxin system VapC family toxin [Anaerolineae bacterium]